MMSIMPQSDVIRRQHVVPACYLQFFTREQSRAGKLWLFDPDADSWRPTTPNAVCIENDFYRQGLLPKDDKHRPFENWYPNLVRRVIAGKRMDRDDQLQLLLFMVHIYVRNPSIAHPPSADRMDLFEKDFDTVVGNIAWSTRLKPKSAEAALDAIRAGWEVRSVQNVSGSWLTSDNPCAFYRAKRRWPVLIVMPMTPNRFAVAVDKRYFAFLSTVASPRDAVLLHSATYGQRRRFGFAHINAKMRGSKASRMAEEHRGETNENGLISTFALYPGCPSRRRNRNSGLSFLRQLRCLC